MLKRSTLDVILVNSFASYLFSRFCLKLKFKELMEWNEANGIFQIVSFKTVFGFCFFYLSRARVIPFDDSPSRVQTPNQSFRMYRDSWYISDFLWEKCFSVSFIET